MAVSQTYFWWLWQLWGMLVAYFIKYPSVGVCLIYLWLEGNGGPLQCSRLENPRDGGAWEAAVHGVAKSWTRLNDFTFTSLSCIGEGNGNPLQCSCLENPRDGGAWWAAVYGVAQSQTWLKWLSSSSSMGFLRDAGSIPHSGRLPWRRVW